MRNLFAIIAAVVLISGGAYSTVWAVDVTKGNEKISKETTESIGTKVTKGVTTKDQIKELFVENHKRLPYPTMAGWFGNIGIPNLRLKPPITSHASDSWQAVEMSIGNWSYFSLTRTMLCKTMT